MSVLSAVLLWLSFPPFNLWPLAWVALVPLFYSLDESPSARAAFGRAYLSGLIFFLAVLQWIHYVTMLGLIFLVVYLALYFGAFGLFYRWSARYSAATRCLLVPAGWVVLEWVRERMLLVGSNWGSIGHSQVEFHGVLDIAGFAGTAGLSFMVVFAGAFLKYVIDSWRARVRMARWIFVPAGLMAAFLFLGFGLAPLGMGLRFALPTAKVALIQPNTPLEEAWSSDLRGDVVHQQLELSRRVLAQKPDLIIWPETSFPQFTWEIPELFDEVKAFARENRVSLLIGTVTRDGGKYFNSALLISPDGQVAQVYNKRHLVVFGEFIPFRKEIPFLSALAPIDDFTAGTEDTVFELPNGMKFSVLICFEDTFSDPARRYVQKGADFLVNITNDAWFGDSGQPRMHLNNAALRAAENGVFLVRATNTGETCGVFPSGAAYPCVEEAGRRVLISGTTVLEVQAPSGRTFYTKYGDIFAFFCLLGILMMVAARWCGQRCERKTIWPQRSGE